MRSSLTVEGNEETIIIIRCLRGGGGVTLALGYIGKCGPEDMIFERFWSQTRVYFSL